VIESPHDYNNNMDTNTRVVLPGVLNMTAVFDPNSKTESGCDWIQFRQGSENITSQMSGTSFPGLCPLQGGAHPLQGDTYACAPYMLAAVCVVAPISGIYATHAYRCVL
jgi:hypothetical protein